MAPEIYVFLSYLAGTLGKSLNAGTALEGHAGWLLLESVPSPDHRKSTKDSDIQPTTYAFALQTAHDQPVCTVKPKISLHLERFGGGDS
jgi:hypothetical protein